jgi:NAD(P)-dependent dehydrogenase (short-subunit alcohol dehydrogenase family)
MGKRALVIGANGALGAAVVRALTAAGHEVAATVSRAHKLDSFRQDMPECTPAIALDLSDAKLALTRLKELVSELPQLDGVIVCPAYAPLKPLEFTSLDNFRETLEINTVAALAIYQATIEALRASGGRLILTSSLSGRVATPMQGAYCASKFALEALADVMRLENAGAGIEVILIEPGGFNTPTVHEGSRALGEAIETAPEKERARYGQLYRQMKYRIDEAVANKGFMQPEDIAAVALEAFEASNPKTRYSVGPEAAFLLSARSEKSDREMDELILDIYRTAPD